LPTVVPVDWRIKALSQRVFSFLPGGEHLNYFAQRWFARSLPVSDSSFAATVGYAIRHIEAIQQFTHRPIDQAIFYEFGAGWDLTVPLAYYGLGINHQILVDVRDLIRMAIVNDTIAKYQKMAAKLNIKRVPAAAINCRKSGFRDALNQQFGVDYRAPCDASQTRLPSQSVDCITSTSTLEHISPADIRSILRECRRILRDDGLMSVLIDYDDHYSYFDRNISVYNYLQYSDQAWKRYSPPLHYQNRLRHRDYIELFQSEGFSITEDQHKAATDKDLKTLRQISLSKRFRSYSLDDLAVHNALLVLRLPIERSSSRSHVESKHHFSAH
jgi:predicted SAM-dependent methyltransferase